MKYSFILAVSLYTTILPLERFLFWPRSFLYLFTAFLKTKHNQWIICIFITTFSIVTNYTQHQQLFFLRIHFYNYSLKLLVIKLSWINIKKKKKAKSSTDIVFSMDRHLNGLMRVVVNESLCFSDP